MKHGGVLQEEEKVVKIIPGTKVIVQTSKGTYLAERLILAPGSWASELLQEIGLTLPLTVSYLACCSYLHGQNCFDLYSHKPDDQCCFNQVNPSVYT